MWPIGVPLLLMSRAYCTSWRGLSAFSPEALIMFFSVGYGKPGFCLSVCLSVCRSVGKSVRPLVRQWRNVLDAFRSVAINHIPKYSIYSEMTLADKSRKAFFTRCPLDIRKTTLTQLAPTRPTHKWGSYGTKIIFFSEMIRDVEWGVRTRTQNYVCIKRKQTNKKTKYDFRKLAFPISSLLPRWISIFLPSLEE